MATSYHNLALLYYYQGRYSEAKPLYQQALGICEQQLGVDNPNTITVKENYIYCLIEVHIAQQR
ncbi:MAG: tetratricopeptide repeat protein [Moorea sp. SIO3G5]|nr:tetratricopeptide repeat protein [Moorena sp. SIO3G5]